MIELMLDQRTYFYLKSSWVLKLHVSEYWSHIQITVHKWKNSTMLR